MDNSPSSTQPLPPTLSDTMPPTQSQLSSVDVDILSQVQTTQAAETNTPAILPSQINLPDGNETFADPFLEGPLPQAHFNAGEYDFDASTFGPNFPWFNTDFLAGPDNAESHQAPLTPIDPDTCPPEVTDQRTIQPSDLQLPWVSGIGIPGYGQWHQGRDPDEQAPEASRPRRQTRTAEDSIQSPPHSLLYPYPWAQTGYGMMPRHPVPPQANTDMYVSPFCFNQMAPAYQQTVQPYQGIATSYNPAIPMGPAEPAWMQEVRALVWGGTELPLAHGPGICIQIMKTDKGPKKCTKQIPKPEHFLYCTRHMEQWISHNARPAQFIRDRSVDFTVVMQELLPGRVVQCGSTMDDRAIYWVERFLRAIEQPLARPGDADADENELKHQQLLYSKALKHSGKKPGPETERRRSKSQSKGPSESFSRDADERTEDEEVGEDGDKGPATNIYSDRWVTVRVMALYMEALDILTGKDRVYPIGGDNAGYGKGPSHPGLDLDDRCQNIEASLLGNKLTAQNVIEGKGVRALAEDSDRYTGRKKQNQKGNLKKQKDQLALKRSRTATPRFGIASEREDDARQEGIEDEQEADEQRSPESEAEDDGEWQPGRSTQSKGKGKAKEKKRQAKDSASTGSAKKRRRASTSSNIDNTLAPPRHLYPQTQLPPFLPPYHTAAPPYLFGSTMAQSQYPSPSTGVGQLPYIYTPPHDSSTQRSPYDLRSAGKPRQPE